MMQTDTMTSITEHLEFLGYRCQAQDDGWTCGAHPTRFDIYLREFPIGVRIVAIFELGPLGGEAHDQWLMFANRCNDAGLMVKFALAARGDGGFLFRASALAPAAYERSSFGAFMDVWHRDLALMEHAPSHDEDADDDEPDEESEIAVRKTGVTH